MVRKADFLLLLALGGLARPRWMDGGSDRTHVWLLNGRGPAGPGVGTRYRSGPALRKKWDAPSHAERSPDENLPAPVHRARGRSHGKESDDTHPAAPLPRARPPSLHSCLPAGRLQVARNCWILTDRPVSAVQPSRWTRETPAPLSAASAAFRASHSVSTASA